jgi:hypothetical protein
MTAIVFLGVAFDVSFWIRGRRKVEARQYVLPSLKLARMLERMEMLEMMVGHHRL